MDALIEKFRRKVALASTHFVRSAMDIIRWDSRLVGIKGARGVGKTTLLLQHIVLTCGDQLDSVLYVSLDDLWFAHNSLTDLVDQFVKTGGKRLYLDEVHKHPDWSRAHELRYPEQGDFLVDNTYTIEIVEKNKGRRQLRGVDDSYVAADDIEYGHGRTIPLWLFGFLH